MGFHKVNIILLKKALANKLSFTIFMEKVDIENLILKELYDWWETSRGSTIYSIFNQMSDVEESVFDRVADNLEEFFLIKGVGYSAPCDITSYGILEAEKRGLIDPEKVNLYESIRYEILKAAAEIYEIEGRYGVAETTKIIEENDFDADSVHNNIRVLNEIGLINADTHWSFFSTEEGRGTFKNSEQQNSLNQEFKSISNLQPQKRGTELQKVIAKSLEFAGWQQEESIKTTYEEVDIIINKSREYYLIECKWENKPIQPIAVNHLLSKLDKRADTNGIVMSMSGFTSGAVKDAEDSLYKKLVLLFGKKDIEEIIANPDSFETLLNKKYKELVTRRKAIFK